ncbi:MerR family transcriptional regulator [Spirochaeta lutea]|uniref:HTH merR-type domain-containing protein n=1 Tax=Spirochaeta lutea TaxID=1480694 RepID=A0A098QVV2_9SPIO|nr:MerR family transcriptional regulator [Spirochaeta lutea]KGE70642.1 hypothetical protein DC28_14080 [Spirochaeta lutea]
MTEYGYSTVSSAGEHEAIHIRFPQGLSCPRLAKLMGRHPNTLRRYEEWGFIEPVRRQPNGYRIYTPRQIIQALFAVTALRAGFQDWQGRRRVKSMISLIVEGSYSEASILLDHHRRDLEERLTHALEVKEIVTSRGACSPGCTQPNTETPGLSRKAAAAELGISPHTIRDWERNALVTPDYGKHHWRLYHPHHLDQLRIIRMLRQAGYSYMGILSLLYGSTSSEDLTFARDTWDQTLTRLIDDSRRMDELLAELILLKTRSMGLPLEG